MAYLRPPFPRTPPPLLHLRQHEAVRRRLRRFQRCPGRPGGCCTVAQGLWQHRGALLVGRSPCGRLRGELTDARPPAPSPLPPAVGRGYDGDPLAQRRAPRAAGAGRRHQLRPRAHLPQQLTFAGEPGERRRRASGGCHWGPAASQRCPSSLQTSQTRAMRDVSLARHPSTHHPSVTIHRLHLSSHLVAPAFHSFACLPFCTCSWPGRLQQASAQLPGLTTCLHPAFLAHPCKASAPDMRSQRVGHRSRHGGASGVQYARRSGTASAHHACICRRAARMGHTPNVALQRVLGLTTRLGIHEGLQRCRPCARRRRRAAVRVCSGHSGRSCRAARGSSPAAVCIARTCAHIGGVCALRTGTGSSQQHLPGLAVAWAQPSVATSTSSSTAACRPPASAR